jgi:hydroxyacylglutathione hydrolase
MFSMKVHILRVLQDNYAYLVEYGDHTLVVDPSESAPIIACVEKLGCNITHILITHHHGDHTGGVAALRARYGAAVMDPSSGPRPLDGVEAIDTPGHCFPHVAYYVPKQKWLFSGDCLFGAGCGRLAGDSAAIMWASLQKLKALPDETEVYFGHEYTRDNLAFAASVEPENTAIVERRARVAKALNEGRFSVPSTITEEKMTNPFLRAGDVEKFALLRRKKNAFVA